MTIPNLEKFFSSLTEIIGLQYQADNTGYGVAYACDIHVMANFETFDIFRNSWVHSSKTNTTNDTDVIFTTSTAVIHSILQYFKNMIHTGTCCILDPDSRTMVAHSGHRNLQYETHFPVQKRTFLYRNSLSSK